MEDNLEKSVDVINGETVEGDSGTPETGMTSGVKRTAEGKGKEPAKKSKRDNKSSKERDSVMRIVVRAILINQGVTLVCLPPQTSPSPTMLTLKLRK